MAGQLRVAIYARFSSDNQRDTSIDDQVRVCSAYIERQGWPLSPNLICADYSVSGASVARVYACREARRVGPKTPGRRRGKNSPGGLAAPRHEGEAAIRVTVSRATRPDASVIARPFGNLAASRS